MIAPPERQPRAARRHARQRVLSIVSVAVSCALILSAQRLHAQVDTAAARNARAALREAHRKFGNRSVWNTLSRQLNLPDVEASLRAGEMAERGVLTAAAEQLRRGTTAEFREEPFPELARQLAARIAELPDIPREDWPTICRRIADNYRPITLAALADDRQRLAQTLAALEKQETEIRPAGSDWKKFLLWTDAQRLAAGGPLPSEILDQLAIRWENALVAWDSDELVEASLAIRSLIPRYRGAIVQESQPDFAAAWQQLAAWTTAAALDDAQQRAHLGAALHERGRLGQITNLAGSIRRELWQPTMQILVRTTLLQQQLAQDVNETYPVNDIFAGTRSVGTGRLVGRSTWSVLPSQSIGQWQLRFQANSSARTTGYSDRVRVVSRATTEVDGSKLFLFTPGGLKAQPARVNAQANVTYDEIDAEGRARRRSEAQRQTYARRPQAESDAAALARRTIAAQLDEAGGKFASEFNTAYRDHFNYPLIHADVLVPLTRMRSSAQTITWSCWSSSPAEFAATLPPPEFTPSGDLTVRVAAGALEDQARMQLAGRRFTGEELGRLLSGSLENDNNPQAETTTSAFAVTFAERPCEIACTDQSVRLTLHIDSFESSDVEYPALVVTATYRVAQVDSGLQLTRDGNLRVQSAASQGERPVSGRQQSLRLAVQRRLGKVLAEKLVWGEIPLPTLFASGTHGKIVGVDVSDGWLQVALDADRKSP